MIVEDVEIAVAGTSHVVATSFSPATRTPDAAITIHPATAVSARLYQPFAEHLARAGFAVVTYDYRGIGKSGGSREHRAVRMRDWMDEDVPSVASWMRSRHPLVPHLAIGHSIGGHALSLNRGTESLAGFVTIAAHAGVTATIERRLERAKVALVLRVLGPATSRTLGYFPGDRMRMLGDMPGAAMLEWSRWSRLPGYFFDDPSMGAAERAAQVETDALVIGFTDDPWGTPGQVDAIARPMVNARVDRRTIDPDDAGLASVGHMGFFRRASRAALWPIVTEWLSERAATAR